MRKYVRLPIISAGFAESGKGEDRAATAALFFRLVTPFLRGTGISSAGSVFTPLCAICGWFVLSMQGIKMRTRAFVWKGDRVLASLRSLNREAISLGLVQFVLLMASGCVSVSDMVGELPVKVEGGLLVNSQGMTLYVFDRDRAAGPGKSVCVKECAANWPPLAAAEDARPSGDYAIITREDGGKQWTYKGRPLYAWTKDRKPGDATGDGLNKVWHAVKP
jgi:predicted lipoprotein with Yx(FWY)xxD motif